MDGAGLIIRLIGFDPEEELVVSYVTQLIPAGNLDDHGKIRALIYRAIID